MRQWSAYLMLAVCLGLGQTAKGDDYFEEEELTDNPAWTEITAPRKGASCLDMCLADGEELFDCEYYCIQTAKIGPLSPREACSRH